MMQTACPTCATVFRITPEQLKTRHGQVRCGKCGQIFDALVTLVDAPSAATALGITLGVSRTPHDGIPNETLNETPTNIPTEAPNETFSETDTQATPVTEAAHPTATEPASLQHVASAETDSTSGTTVSPEKPAASKLEAYFRASLSRASAWPWILAALLSLLMLLAQIILQFRVELAVIEPALKPALQSLCEPLACDIPLPRKAELLSIDSTDLHPDPQHKELLILSATLKNRAPFAQVYPSLELTLTNSEGQPQIRKIIAPNEYLARQANVTTATTATTATAAAVAAALTAGFGAHQELDVNIALTPEKSSKPAPTDYRLYLFYP